MQKCDSVEKDMDSPADDFDSAAALEYIADTLDSVKQEVSSLKVALHEVLVSLLTFTKGLKSIPTLSTSSSSTTLSSQQSQVLQQPQLSIHSESTQSGIQTTLTPVQASKQPTVGEHITPSITNTS